MMAAQRPLARALVCAVFALMMRAASVEAQQVCYAYDSAGRLTGVIDENRNAAFYQYDAVGNILSIARKSPTGPVTVYAVYPLSGAPGEQFEIFGVGFSSTASDNQVTIGGVAAAVSSTVPCTLVVDVPVNGITGPVHVTTPAGQDTSTDSFLVSRFAIASSAQSVLPNILVQFTVTSNGCNDSAVVWRVNGTLGGGGTVGTIDANGLYTAPPAVPTPAYVVIRGESVMCPTLFDEKTLNIVTNSTAFVLAAASAIHGAAPVVFPAQVVMARASANFGSPTVELPANTVLASASAATGPFITSISPSSRTRPSSFQITVGGINLAGATGLTFLGASAPDPAITVSNVVVSADGTSLTANVAIASTATTGTRTIRVDRPAGNSTTVPTNTNVFTVTQ